MGKYRLKVKGGKMPFTFMEIDTDCHAWYIHADSTEAAVRCLCDMAGELQGIDSFYVNGDDVTEKVADACLRIMHQRQQEASDIPLPEDEDYLGGAQRLYRPHRQPGRLDGHGIEERQMDGCDLGAVWREAHKR